MAGTISVAARPSVGRGFDMNCLPPADEDDSSSSSPNSNFNLFSIAPSPWPTYTLPPLKRRSDDEEEEEEEEEEAGMTRKKLRLSKDQSAVLEQSFRQQSTLNPKQKMALAKQLDLKPRQVEVWFQNRRARTKLKQTEMDCELLRRCCESLTEENRRLQKEVQELRALKVFTREHPMHLPAATLAMCPSCEKVGSTASVGRTPPVATFLPKFPTIVAPPSVPSRQFSFFRQPSAA